MAKFNPTKAQREMIKIILSDLKNHKEKVALDRQYTGENFIENARGAAWLMYRLAFTDRERVAAERVFELVLNVQYLTVLDLPDTAENLSRKARHERTKARVARNRKAAGLPAL